MDSNDFVEWKIKKASMGNYKSSTENFKTAGNIKITLLMTSNKITINIINSKNYFIIC